MKECKVRVILVSANTASALTDYTYNPLVLRPTLIYPHGPCANKPKWTANKYASTSSATLANARMLGHDPQRTRGRFFASVRGRRQERVNQPEGDGKMRESTREGFRNI